MSGSTLTSRGESWVRRAVATSGPTTHSRMRHSSHICQPNCPPRSPVSADLSQVSPSPGGCALPPDGLCSAAFLASPVYGSGCFYLPFQPPAGRAAPCRRLPLRALAGRRLGGLRKSGRPDPPAPSPIPENGPGFPALVSETASSALLSRQEGQRARVPHQPGMGLSGSSAGHREAQLGTALCGSFRLSSNFSPQLWHVHWYTSPKAAGLAPLTRKQVYTG